MILGKELWKFVGGSCEKKRSPRHPGPVGQGEHYTCHPEKDSLFSIQECGDEATVGDLLEALSNPGFMDVKLRVEKLMKINVTWK